MALHDAPSPLSAKKSMYAKMTPEMKKRTIQSGGGITPGGGVDTVVAGVLAVRRLVEPLVVGGLLGRGLRLDRAAASGTARRPRG